MEGILHGIETRLWHRRDTRCHDTTPHASAAATAKLMMDPNNTNRTAPHDDHCSVHSTDDKIVDHDYCSSCCDGENCSKQRAHIREGKAKCIVCMYYCQGNAKECHRDFKGCPGCHAVVCRKHWKEFDHRVDHWIR